MIELLTGNEAYNYITNSSFIQEWDRLLKVCNGSCFQSKNYIPGWYRLTKDEYTPIVVFEWKNDKLIGFLPLALSIDKKDLIYAGHDEIEYQAWLEEDNHKFINKCWKKIKSLYPSPELDLRFVPSYLKFNKWLFTTTLNVKSPLLMLNEEEILSSLKKKGNRSRINKLNKLGNLEFKHIIDYNEFVNVYDTIIQDHNDWHEKIHNCRPFEDNVYRKQHQLNIFKNNPRLLHVTVFYLDGKVISGHVGGVTGDTVHLGTISHNEKYNHLSLGKIHLKFLTKMLVQNGFKCLDLTPGYDSYKFQMCNTIKAVRCLKLHSSVYSWAKHSIMLTISEFIHRYVPKPIITAIKQGI